MSQSKRREFLKRMSLGPAALACARQLRAASGQPVASVRERPNILVLMSDNHSWNHLGCYGDSVVRTPNIDRFAERGVRFSYAFCAAPSCTPARAAMLTGQDIWRLEEGANLWGILSHRFPLYTDLLESSGYHVGCQGKGWGPGNVPMSGRTRNHGGAQFDSFPQFLEANPDSRPWTFWYSSRQPHRPHELGAGTRSGLDFRKVVVPPYLPDDRQVREDICDYYRDIEKFDQQVGEILTALRASGQEQNTLVIICSDNGWQMPRGLANLYDSGSRIPLLAAWPGRIRGGRVVDDFVTLNDFAPTFLELAGAPVPDVMTARSLVDLFLSEKSGRVEPTRDRVFTGRERHALCRRYGVGYPGRAVRTHDFLYIRNYEPGRWPAGDPPLFGDVDAWQLQFPSPTKEFMLVHRHDPSVRPLFGLAFEKRPAEELFDLRRDPYQMKNVVGLAEYREARQSLAGSLTSYLRQTEDPRVMGGKTIWDTSMYYQALDYIARPSPYYIQLLGLEAEYNYMK